MWGDEGSDDEYLAALDDFERGQPPQAPLAAASKQHPPQAVPPALGAAPHQPPAPLQQRNGAVAAPPPVAPPPCLGVPAAAAPLGPPGVRQLFRRPSAAGMGLPAPAASAAAVASPAPTASAQQSAAGWRPQQDPQQQAPQHQQQQWPGRSRYAGPPQAQVAAWNARPAYSVMQQPQRPQQQPSMQSQRRPQHSTPQQQPGMQQHQRPQHPAAQPPTTHHQRPQQWPCQPPACAQQPQVMQHPPQQPAMGRQQQQQQCSSAATPRSATEGAQQQVVVSAGQRATMGAPNPQPASAGAAEAPPAAAGEPVAAGAGTDFAAVPAAIAAAAAAAAAAGGGAAAGEAPAGAPTAAAAEAVAAGDQPKRKLKQLFDFLLVYDLEATCDADKSKQPQPQEIIELSCVAVDTASLCLLPSTFQRYVRPDQHPLLTQFCTELTGITQDMVDGGVPLREALAQHEAWLREQGILGKGRTFVPVTWRDWDLKVQMAMETKWRGIEQPKYLKRWVDLSALWFKHSKSRGNLRASVEAAGLQWEGRAHSAIDDARNTARLAIKLMQSGVILGITGSFSGVDASGRFKQATLQLGGGSASGGGKPNGGGAAGPGPASGGTGRASGGGARSGGSSLGYGFGAQQQQQPAKKKKIFDADGAWNGCCFCGVRAKKRQVKRPGPNNGREFWSCGKFSMTGGGPTWDLKFARFT